MQVGSRSGNGYECFIFCYYVLIKIRFVYAHLDTIESSEFCPHGHPRYWSTYKPNTETVLSQLPGYMTC